MPIFNRQDRKDLDQLVEEYITTSNVSRREFLRRAGAAGLSVSAASALLAACGGGTSGGPSGGGSSAKVTSIDALTEWSGVELDAFNAINSAFKKNTGIQVNVESTRDLPAILSTRLRGNNPPDIAGMPTIATFKTLAAQKKLLRLDTFFDMNAYKQQYAQGWIDFTTVNGGVYAVLPKANGKTTIWYSPKQFQANGYTVPQTWEEMISLSDKIAASGKYPWSIGVESGASSGWAAGDWVDQIYLSKYGPDMYDQWWQHKIPWTHSSVKDAFQMFGQIAHGKNYVNGGAQFIQSTNFQDATYLPFYTPPKAYMTYLGDFAAGFITGQFKGIKAGTDFNFFAFPTLNQQYKGAVTGGADLMAAFKDNDGTRQYLQFISSPEGQSIWPSRGGATSLNKAVSASVYPNDLARQTAQLLSGATLVRVGADDLMPQAVENEFWKGLLTYIGDATQLDSVLTHLESIAQQNYSS